MTYCLHLLDGSRLHRDSVIVVNESSESPVIETALRNVSKGENLCVDKSWMLGPVTTHNEAKVLALIIAARYNYDVIIDGERQKPHHRAWEIQL